MERDKIAIHLNSNKTWLFASKILETTIVARKGSLRLSIEYQKQNI